MSNTSYETHSEAQQSGFAVERTSSGESELSSSLTEANDSELYASKTRCSGSR